MQNELNYRDGHEQTDVAPVLVDRLANGMRVVVRFPRHIRVRARNRFLLTIAIIAAYEMLVLQAATRPRLFWLGFGGSMFPIAVMVVFVMGIVWWRSGWLYAFEADARELRVESQGRFWTRRRRCRRDQIRDIRVEEDRRGRAVAITIFGTVRPLAGRYFDGLEARHLRIIADALREGLGMPAVPAALEPPRQAEPKQV
jgi:hypothetical protein